MASMKAILLAGAFVVGAANFAAAADLLPMPPPPVEVPPPQFPASICAATSGSESMN